MSLAALPHCSPVELYVYSLSGKFCNPCVACNMIFFLPSLKWLQVLYVRMKFFKIVLYLNLFCGWDEGDMTLCRLML